MKANSKQVGGNHYKTGTVEHWDVFGPEYLVANATKYVGRWRKKNGVQDLEKALHYAEKLKECGTVQSMPNGNWETLEQWLNAIQADWVERSIIKSLIIYKIDEAIEGIKYLIEREMPNDPDLFTISPEKLLKSLGNSEVKQRTPEDGAQHSSVYPWVVDEDPVMHRSDLNYYVKRGNFCALEPFVTVPVPDYIRQCYTFVPGVGSILKIEDCPFDAREYFPNMITEKNATEYGELPAWQRALYEWNGQKYLLTNEAWHVQEEL